MRSPINIRAGAVAAAGIIRKIGLSKSAAKKSRPTIIAVIPVRPPDSIPAADSPYTFAVEQPSPEAPIVANASAVSAVFGSFISPCALTKPARWHMAFIATKELNRSKKTSVSNAGKSIEKWLNR